MDILKELSMAFIWLIRAGTVTRVAYCFLKMMTSDEEQGVYKKRMRNALVFKCISFSSISRIHMAIKGYDSILFWRIAILS